MSQPPLALPLPDPTSNPVAQRALRRAIDIIREQAAADRGEREHEAQALEQLYQQVFQEGQNLTPAVTFEWLNHGVVAFLDQSTRRRFFLSLRNGRMARDLSQICARYLARAELVGWEPGPLSYPEWDLGD